MPRLKSSGGRKVKTFKPRGQKTPKSPSLTPSPKLDPLDAELAPRDLAFVQHYCVHFNQTRAAIEAGFPPKSAHVRGSNLVRDGKVAAAIMRRRVAQAQKLELSQERVAQELMRVGYANMADYAPLYGEGTPAEKLAMLTRDQAAAVQEIVVEEFRDGRTRARQVRRTKFKLADKRGSLELLARHLGMVSDKVDHNVVHSGTIVHALLKEIDDQTRGRPIIDAVPSLPAPKEGEAA